MEETTPEVSNTSTTTALTTDSTTTAPTTDSTTTAPTTDSTTTAPTTDSTTIQLTTTSPRLCKVCGGPACYSNYGAVVCYSCKVFFKRNSGARSATLKCNSGDHCLIDVNYRRICPACRLAKCFASGMKVELIRSSWTKQTKKSRKKKSTTTNPPSTALAIIEARNQSAEIPTVNLLRADQSTLTVEQWNHLSNLVHCFDDYSGFASTQHFIDEQTALPPKFRFKYTSVNQFFISMMTKVQLVSEKNRDSLSLSLHDRTTLLRSTVENTTSMGGAFILQQAHLFDHPTFIEAAELIFQPSAVALMKRLIDRLDPDTTFMKIIFTIVAFLISNYTVYTSIPATHLTDFKSILRIQDMYTELLWRYLLYRHNHHDAVLCFSNLLRCLFLVNDSVVEAHEAQQYTDIIDSVVEATEQKLTLNN